MAMTGAVKDELSRLVVTKPCCRRAEVAALLRFAGGLHIVGGRVVGGAGDGLVVGGAVVLGHGQPRGQPGVVVAHERHPRRRPALA